MKESRWAISKYVEVIGTLAVIVLTGCTELLEVSNPSSVEEDDLNNPALAVTLLNSALGQFECAYTSYVASTAVLSQELIDSSNWAALNGWGQRGVQLETITGTCPTSRTADGLGAYTPLQQARYMAEDGIKRIEGFDASLVPDREEILATLEIYGAYSTLLLGEGFCEMAIDKGPLMTREEVFDRALSGFDRALSRAEEASVPDLVNLAKVGRARTNLNLGNHQAAYRDAMEIPKGFVWHAEYSTNDASRENRLYNMNRLNRYLSANASDYAGLTVGGMSDPRVVIINSGLIGHDNLTEHWYQEKYSAADAPIILASWAEAQLIVAETSPQDAEVAINRLRESQGIPALTIGPGDDIMEIVLEERRRELYLEGHRLNDMLRHDLPFPTGFNHKGQAWGPITCMPLPDQERRNNPNIQ